MNRKRQVMLGLICAVSFGYAMMLALPGPNGVLIGFIVALLLGSAVASW